MGEKLKQADITPNMVFGKWTIIENNRDKCLARCACGLAKSIDTHNLISGRSTQCRKCSAGKGETHHNWNGGVDNWGSAAWANRLVIAHNATARRRGYATLALTSNEIVEIAKNYNGQCKLCGGATPKPNFDHCHITGKFRGLLCPNCNKKLGWAERFIEQVNLYLSA